MSFVKDVGYIARNNLTIIKMLCLCVMVKQQSNFWGNAIPLTYGEFLKDDIGRGHYVFKKN